MAMRKAAAAFPAGDDAAGREVGDAVTSGSAKAGGGRRFPSPGPSLAWLARYGAVRLIRPESNPSRAAIATAAA